MDTTERPEQKPATAARIYDFYIGGTHNFAEDRAAAQAALDQVPLIRPAARANRAFLGRAVRFAADAGIRQFIDVGSGIPTEGNVHEIAQEVDPEARVIYVDIDPVAVAEGLEILAGNDYATSIRGNVLDAGAILAHPAVTALIDFDQPVAIIMCALLHFVPDDEAAHAAVATFRGVSAPGSYLILTHGTSPDDGAQDQERADFAEGERVVKGLYERRTTTPVRMRTRPDIQAFFQGYDMVEPGLSWVGEWRATDGDQPEFAGNSRLASVLGGVGTLR